MPTSVGPKAASEQFTVAGLEFDDNGAITFSDGSSHNVVVNIVNGAPVSTSVNLSGMTDGLVTALLSVSDAAGNTFSAHASAQLEQSLGKSVTVTFTDANIGRVKAASEQFTVSGLGSDDNGAITFSDGRPPQCGGEHCQRGAGEHVGQPVRDDGRAGHGVVVGERRSRQHVQRACIGSVLDQDLNA